jgi:monoamine oxidase
LSGDIQRADVIVVGAGFTGLSAARRLVEAGLGVMVLEARDRVGGRVEASRNGLGELVDTGGQFICDDMPEVMALARKYGKQISETHLKGAFLTQPPLPEREAERTYAASMAMRDRLNEIEPDDPAIGGLSVADWMASQPEKADAKAAFRSMIEGLWCVGLEALPAWYLISNDRRVTNDVSELQFFLPGTLHSLAADLATGLGDRVCLGRAATSIEHMPDGVRVWVESGDGGYPIAARVVLVAVPPMTARRIEFSPALPEPLQRALGAWESGKVLKALVRYQAPFWREKGLSGMVAWREPTAYFAFDTSQDDKHAMLTFFVGGPHAASMAAGSEAAARAEALSRLEAALGPEAGRPVDVVLRDWTADRWSGGAYSDVILDMDATDAEDVMRAGAPPVFFASSELSPSFPGYVEGAIVAGRIAANEIIAALNKVEARV